MPQPNFDEFAFADDHLPRNYEQRNLLETKTSLFETYEADLRDERMRRHGPEILCPNEQQLQAKVRSTYLSLSLLD